MYVFMVIKTLLSSCNSETRLNGIKLNAYLHVYELMCVWYVHTHVYVYARSTTQPSSLIEDIYVCTYVYVHVYVYV